MLTEGEVRALTVLHGEQTVSEFATQLDRSLSYTSELVDRLEATGLVETRRQGKTKQIRPSDAKALELLADITQEYSHIDWPELLSGATLRVLYYLETPRVVMELARRANIHRSTVHRALDPLQHRGIIYETDEDAYVLNEGFEQLSTLARELVHHDHRQTVEQHTDTYTILWESLDEFLVQTADEITAEDFLSTGPERFQTYDLPLLARDRRYYFHSETMNDLSPAMLCCHMLVIDSGARTQSYCLLLLSHVDVDRDELRDQATKYGVDDLVEDLLTYLDTSGEERASRLPEWEEFQELAADYGVSA
ncbi:MULTISPECIES: winged helix-turn-helix domain-containing protein [Halobacteriales]|jgi:DNA-binding MarR family transcriptional regulator|uniref:MarR family transcriptional regulator n=3 Tax=Halobacteriales TaxID=2235 RepID=A0A830FGP4_9EURY|nr:MULTISPECIES: winged helix-turn-helix domain-containing protein [Halobacteria]MCD2200660.1 helix-turn-helix domain-containing protein [Halobacterium sp. KA-4]MCF2207965.1 helix-turn-helix domain-containing protein [Halobacterium salinarum]MCF2240251.1 helix-turn-helix domain-containing protein [Halobacterium salinarum]GGL72726.1 MarR family transcriptional regulator [Halocalculus aciditolerans]